MQEGVCYKRPQVIGVETNRAGNLGISVAGRDQSILHQHRIEFVGSQAERPQKYQHVAGDQREHSGWVRREWGGVGERQETDVSSRVTSNVGIAAAPRKTGGTANSHPKTMRGR